MKYDEDKLDKAALVMLLLNQESQLSGRSWKTICWDIMNRLFEAGFISDPKTKNKSVFPHRIRPKQGKTGIFCRF